MDDDNTQGTPAPSAAEIELQKVKAKNAELLAEKKALQQRFAGVPEDVDVQALIKAQQDAEQSRLLASGEYDKARQQLQEQYNRDIKAKDDRIAQLEARVRDLELISPAASKLAEVVHDPDDVFATGRLKPDQIENDASGPVVVNGLTRTPIAEWARANLPTHYLKRPPASGSGAPAGGGSGGGDPAADADLRFFVRGGKDESLTEQSRIYRLDPDRYQKLRAAAKAMPAS